ncbi:hypothetical protein HWD94_11655 [Pseudarthrobacter equi]|uniref:hypothetical protein n=1 Tax=Pseudarthrobacter equi TaxID=728066 RepID=UPI0021C1095A|nr:hypothetical protein [Pseudarthrobacter equi]MCT9625778.1 hypothetical protein [Pseudarthrobacter equi]
MVHLIEAATFGELAAKTKAACSSSPILNVVLSVQAALPASNDFFLQTYRVDAEKWQAPEVPADLVFNHGNYMHRHGDSLNYLITELKNKPSGNRACISLVDAADIMASKDGKLPSFLLLQAAIGTDGKKLIMTAYYRALEVSVFLPINLAEMALIADKIGKNHPTLESVDLTLHAFRAHDSPQFRAHTRSALDIAAVEGEIVDAVAAENRQLIATWLLDKARHESVIDTVGLATLTAELTEAGWEDDVVSELNVAVGLEAQLAYARTMGTHAHGVKSLQEELSSQLSNIARMLRKPTANRGHNGH